jgi:hypothetical protein
MQEFMAKHSGEIAGVWANQVRLTEFGRHGLRASERLKQACRARL